jgi:hypothetical protein
MSADTAVFLSGTVRAKSALVFPTECFNGSITQWSTSTVKTEMVSTAEEMAISPVMFRPGPGVLLVSGCSVFVSNFILNCCDAARAGRVHADE